jgi:hypothetical protein
MEKELDMVNIFDWYNIIFLIPLTIGLLMIIGSALGVLGHGEVGHDIGHDMEHDVGHDTGHDNDHSAKSGHAGALDLNADTAHGFFSWTLSFLGIGRVPFSVLLMVCSILFGGIGMSVNYMIMPLLKAASIIALFSIGASCVVTFFLTGAIARLVNRLMPSTESYNVTKRGLIGATGKIVIAANPDNGFADIRDKYSGIQRIDCRCLNGLLPIGTEIVVIDYREEDGRFVVEQLQD